MPYNPSPFQSSSFYSLRNSTSPQQTLHLFKLRIRRRRPPNPDPFDPHSAAFTLKSCSTSAAAGAILLHLHAYFLKTALLSHVHVSSCLLHGYALSSLHHARLLFDEIPNRNVVTSNTMVTCYSRNGDLSAAKSIFDQMPEHDIASWSALIGGCMSNGRRAQGFMLFREMMKIGECRPDQLMLVTLLSGLADIGLLQRLGKSIHAYITRNGLEINAQLGTSLIDMYAKSGCWKSAFRVFERAPERNVMHWTAMICGLANHGYGEEAVAFFEEMVKKKGLRPNEITFTGVLNACCHAGMIERGEEYFVSMVEEFGFEPSIHHYGCMVDMFAKAGKLEDAHLVIEKMTVEPNIVVWTSFLAACKKHKNFGIAEKAMEKVLKMVIPDEDGGVYTLISDLYALGGKWNDVERVRKMMDRHNVRKNRGSAFIELEEFGT